MSRWTHVNGIIRLWHIHLPGFRKPPRFKVIEREFKVSIPCGSEGPLAINVLRDYGGGDLNYAIVTITGDLRDYGEPQDIKNMIEWLKSTLERLKERYRVFVWDVVLHIQDEYGTEVILFMDDDEKWQLYVHSRSEDYKEMEVTE